MKLSKIAIHNDNEVIKTKTEEHLAWVRDKRKEVRKKLLIKMESARTITDN